MTALQRTDVLSLIGQESDLEEHVSDVGPLEELRVEGGPHGLVGGL